MPTPTLPVMEKITELQPHEVIMQVVPFNGSIACLTSLSRVLIAGSEFGEWLLLPVPAPAQRPSAT